MAVSSSGREPALFDTHAHLHDPAFDGDRDDVLQRARDSGVRRLITVGTDLDTSVAAIKIVQATALRMLRNDVAARPVLSNWQALLDYLRADMAHLGVERVRVLHLNT